MQRKWKTTSVTTPSSGRRVSETQDGSLDRSFEWDNLGYLARITTRVEFVLVDSKSEIVKVYRSRFARFFLSNYYSAYYVSSVRASLRKHEGKWIVGYPSFMKPRPAKQWRSNKPTYPHNYETASLLNKIFNTTVAGYITGDFDDAIKFGLPNLSEDALAEYFASNPPYCEPLGYDEFVASQGNEK